MKTTIQTLFLSTDKNLHRKIILATGLFLVATTSFAQIDSSTNQNRSLEKMERGSYQNNDPSITNPGTNYNPDKSLDRDGSNSNKSGTNLNRNSISNSNSSLNEINSDGYLMRDGKVLIWKNGQATEVGRETTLSNGTRVMGDGTVVKKDGKKYRLQEGEWMDLNGVVNNSNRSIK